MPETDLTTTAFAPYHETYVPDTRINADIATVTAGWYNTNTTTTTDNRWTLNGTIEATNPLDLNTVTYGETWTYPITQHDLDNFAKRIFKIIEEHTKIDITEEEFMKLMKEDE